MSTSPDPIAADFAMLCDGLPLPPLDGSTVSVQLLGELPDPSSPGGMLYTSNVAAESNAPTRGKRFEGSEHTFIGESIVLRVGEGANDRLPGSQPLHAFGLPTNRKDKSDPANPTPIMLTCGQIVALAMATRATSTRR